VKDASLDLKERVYSEDIVNNVTHSHLHMNGTFFVIGLEFGGTQPIKEQDSHRLSIYRRS
jgi:hypothetical protein